VKVSKKGKKIIVKGKEPGMVLVVAYGKKNVEIGSWLVKVE
jgi:hypothetical protein